MHQGKMSMFGYERRGNLLSTSQCAESGSGGRGVDIQRKPTFQVMYSHTDTTCLNYTTQVNMHWGRDTGLNQIILGSLAQETTLNTQHICI